MLLTPGKKVLLHFFLKSMREKKLAEVKLGWKCVGAVTNKMSRGKRGGGSIPCHKKSTIFSLQWQKNEIVRPSLGNMITESGID